MAIPAIVDPSVVGAGAGVALVLFGGGVFEIVAAQRLAAGQADVGHGPFDARGIEGRQVAAGQAGVQAVVGREERVLEEGGVLPQRGALGAARRDGVRQRVARLVQRMRRRRRRLRAAGGMAVLRDQ